MKLSKIMSLSILSLLMIFAWTSNAEAQMAVGVDLGVKGCVNGSFINEPGEKTFEGNPADTIYPGWAGVGNCYGFFLEPRVDIIGFGAGLEIGFISSTANGSGNVSQNGGPEHEITLTSKDLIIPIHLKLHFPFVPTFGMHVGVGVDISLPSSVEIATGALGTQVAIAERETTNYLGFQAGFEFTIPAVGIRIPLDLRGRWNSGTTNNFDGRISKLGNPVTYIPNWDYQAEVHLGVIYPFSIL